MKIKAATLIKVLLGLNNWLPKVKFLPDAAHIKLIITCLLQNYTT